MIMARRPGGEFTSDHRVQVSILKMCHLLLFLEREFPLDEFKLMKNAHEI